MNQFHTAEFQFQSNLPAESQSSNELGDFARNLLMQAQPVSMRSERREAQAEKEIRNASSAEIDVLSSIAAIPPQDLNNILDSVNRGFLGTKLEEAISKALNTKPRDDDERAPLTRDLDQLDKLVTQLNLLLKAKNSDYEIRWNSVAPNQHAYDDYGSLIVGVAKTEDDFFDMTLGYLHNNGHTPQSRDRLFERMCTKAPGK